MSEILNKKIVEIDGYKFKRISIREGLIFQNKIFGFLIKNIEIGKEVELDLKKIATAIIENFDLVTYILELFYAGDIDELEMGQEYEIIEILIKKHPNIQKIVDTLKNAMGKKKQ